MRAWDPQRVARAPPGSITSTSDRTSLALHTQQDPIASAMVGKGIARSALVGQVFAQVFGLALLAAVVLWRLGRATPRADLETLCNAEGLSGFTLRHDRPALAQWTLAHLATPEGNELFAALSDEAFGDRARRLEQEATAAGVRPCPLVRSFDEVAVDAEYRRDMQHVCSTATFPALADLDPPARLQALEEWITVQATSPRTRTFAESLRLSDPVDRAAVLRSASRAAGVLTCDVARSLEVDLDAQ
jgi:hypothetical protein